MTLITTQERNAAMTSVMKRCAIYFPLPAGYIEAEGGVILHRRHHVFSNMCFSGGPLYPDVNVYISII